MLSLFLLLFYYQNLVLQSRKSLARLRANSLASRETLTVRDFSHTTYVTILWQKLRVLRGFNMSYVCIFLHSTVWKIKNLLSWRIFRQIISLVISVVKTLLSRNFCHKCVRVNFRNKHTVLYCKLQIYFEKNFVKLPEQILLYSDFTKYISYDTNSRFSTTLWKNEKFTLNEKKFVKSTI